MSAAPVKARRGDLAVLVSVRQDFVIGQGSSVSTQVDVVQVASVTREGVVKAVRSVWRDSTPLPLARWPHANPQVLLVSRDRIDVEAALTAARAHAWPGHPDQPMPFDSVEEARDLLRPFLTASAETD